MAPNLNKMATETKILQWMDWNIFGNLNRQTTDFWSGIEVAPRLALFKQDLLLN